MAVIYRARFMPVPLAARPRPGGWPQSPIVKPKVLCANCTHVRDRHVSAKGVTWCPMVGQFRHVETWRQCPHFSRRG